MNRKVILLIIAIFSLIFFFVSKGKQYEKTITTENTHRQKQPVTPEPQHKKKKRVTERKFKNRIRSLDDITVEEIKEQKNIGKTKEEFDLTPSRKDLIRMKKERIQTY